MSEATGLIIAAVIAGFVAFLSLIIRKEQTVSDCRQQWIDELRKGNAAVGCCISSIHGHQLPDAAFVPKHMFWYAGFLVESAPSFLSLTVTWCETFWYTLRSLVPRRSGGAWTSAIYEAALGVPKGSNWRLERGVHPFSNGR
jgi:hypothetical protein